MSNWFAENIAKLATAWQAGFLFTVWIFTTLFNIMGIGIVDSAGCLILLGMGFAFTAYLFTITKVFKVKDKVIDVTPKEQFTVKQSIALIEDVFGLRPKTAFVPASNDSPVEVDLVTRDEFKELTAVVQRTLELVSVESG